MKLLRLRDCYHSRHDTIFDVSNNKVVMVSNKDVDTSGNINEADCYLPSQFASDVLKFLVQGIAQ